MTAEKKCAKCLAVLPLTSFSPHKAMADGLHSYCKRCRVMYTLQYQRRMRSGDPMPESKFGRRRNGSIDKNGKYIMSPNALAALAEIEVNEFTAKDYRRARTLVSNSAPTVKTTNNELNHLMKNGVIEQVRIGVFRECRTKRVAA